MERNKEKYSKSTSDLLIHKYVSVPTYTGTHVFIQRYSLIFVFYVYMCFKLRKVD